MQKLEAARSSVEIARSWLSKGQPGWALRCSNSALMGYLSIGVAEHSDLDSFKRWLEEQEVTKLLTQHCTTLRMLADAVDRGATPGSTLGGAYGHLAIAHLASLVEADEVESALVSTSIRADVYGLSTPLWRLYSATYSKMLGSENSAEPVAKTSGSRWRGLEKYWQGYITLMAARTTGGNLEAQVQVVDELFVARNKDMKLDDGYEIEGTGLHPTKLDFRKLSILAPRIRSNT